MYIYNNNIKYIYIFWHSFWQAFWHSFRHLFWHSVLFGICSDILSGSLSGMCSDPGVPSCLQSSRSAASGAGDRVEIQACPNAAGPRDVAHNNWNPQSRRAARGAHQEQRRRSSRRKSRRKKKEELHRCQNLETLTWQVGNKHQHLCSPRPSLGQLISRQYSISKRIMTSIISICFLAPLCIYQTQTHSILQYPSVYPTQLLNAFSVCNSPCRRVQPIVQLHLSSPTGSWPGPTKVRLWVTSWAPSGAGGGGTPKTNKIKCRGLRTKCQ